MRKSWCRPKCSMMTATISAKCITCAMWSSAWTRIPRSTTSRSSATVTVYEYVIAQAEAQAAADQPGAPVFRISLRGELRNGNAWIDRHQEEKAAAQEVKGAT